MYMTTFEPINPRTAAWRKIGKPAKDWEVETRHFWRKIKRNSGRKIKSLRTHRTGARG